MASKSTPTPPLSPDELVESIRVMREQNARSRAKVERHLASLRRIAAELRARGR